MNFPSKDAPLDQSIATMEKVLATMNCALTFSHEKHPLSHCYSVNLTSTLVPDHLYSNGKGVESKAATASGLGEYIERLQTNLFFSEFYLGKRNHYPDQINCNINEAYLTPSLQKFYDPDQQLQPSDLVDFNSDDHERVVALPFIDLTNQQTVYFPVNILHNLYMSNGLASGNSPQEAQVQALSEIIERYVKIKIIKKGYALPPFPQDSLESFTKIHKDVQSLRRLGYIVEVLDASLGGRFPVTAISLINPEKSTLFVSFGAHPTVEVALERTMTELMQGRDLDGLDSFETPTFEMSFVADPFNLESHFIDSNGTMGFPFLSTTKSFTYTPWSYSGQGCAEEYTFLDKIIKAMNKTIYLREYDYLDFYSCQVIVPGISEIYPVEDLVYNNRNVGKWLRPLVLNFATTPPDDILAEIIDLDDAIKIDNYIGVLFKTPFTMLEFKAQIQLLAGQPQEALATLSFSEQKKHTILVELLRMEQNDLDWQNYKTAFIDLFGKETVAQARQIITGDAFLIDTSFHPDYTTILNTYDTLAVKKSARIKSR